MNKIKADTIIRTIVLLIALINQALTLTGKSVIPIEDEQIADLISTMFTIGASVWAWWKNNSFTKAAIEADKVMHELKSKNEEEEEEQ